MDDRAVFLGDRLYPTPREGRLLGGGERRGLGFEEGMEKPQLEEVSLHVDEGHPATFEAAIPPQGGRERNLDLAGHRPEALRPPASSVG